MKIFRCLFSLFIISTTAIYSQNITNTVGNSGTFYIKDGTTNFLTITQSTGQTNILKGLRLELTGSSSTTGVIFKGTDKFIHDFSASGSYGRNTFIGINSGNFTMAATSLLHASNNTGVGNSALMSLTTGHNNTASGYKALNSNTTGYRNTASGSEALALNTTGRDNTALGMNALKSQTTGYSNTAIGSYASVSNISGNNNTASGYGALYFNTGSSNTATGSSALYRNTTGSYNTAMGYQAGNKITTGSYITAIGNQAGLSATTGNSNTMIGYRAGWTVTTGSNLTILGYNAQASSVTATNEVTLGNSYIATLRCATTSITSLSDARDKKNIKDLALGIDFLMKIKPRQFNWDKREWYKQNLSDGSKIKKAPTAGFIAQELDEVQTSEKAEWLNLVLKSNPDKWEATYGNLLPVMVKAIQDLKNENDELKTANSKLAVTTSEAIKNIKNENKELKIKLANYEQIQNILVVEIEKLKSSNTIIAKVNLGVK